MSMAEVLYYHISLTNASLIVILNFAELAFLVKQYRRSRTVGVHQNATPIIFLGNLALSDLLVGLLIILIKVFEELMLKECGFENIANEKFHHLIKSSALQMSLLTSVFNLILLTLDRLFAARSPIAYRARATNRRAFVFTAVTWIVSVVLTTIHYFVSYYRINNFFKFNAVIFPVVVLPATLAFAVCNFLIVKAVRGHGLRLRSMTRSAGCPVSGPATITTAATQNSSNCIVAGLNTETERRVDEGSPRVASRLLRRELRIHRLALTVVVAFITCWLPLAIYCLVLLFKAKLYHHLSLNIVFTLAFFNASIDPLVYFCFKINFWRKARKLCSMCWRQSLS